MSSFKTNTPKGESMSLIKVCYQGVPGAYSHIAISRYFKNKARAIPCYSFDKLFNKVESQQCLYGMVPIENSIGGSVYQNYDLLTNHDLSIVGEVYLKITHNLLVVPTKGEDKNKRLHMIKKAYSHPEAIKQCQSFFNSHPWIKPVAAEDTAGSAKDLAQSGIKESAAIASNQSARIYSLRVLKKAIETDRNNFTRFVIVGQKQKIVRPSKVSIIFSVAHKPGSLYKSLTPFAQKKINLTKIESRPIIGKPWEYLFYLDFEINSYKECQQTLEELKKNCLHLKILGFYQKGKTVIS